MICNLICDHAGVMANDNTVRSAAVHLMQQVAVDLKLQATVQFEHTAQQPA